MARALVVFESMFGDTESIARAVAEGLSTAMDAEVVEVGSAPTSVPGDVDALIVGGPTHAFGISRPSTRRQAAAEAQGRVVSRGVGLREWLDALDGASGQAAAAAFDTRLAKPRWLQFLNRATRGIEKRLRRAGFRIVAPGMPFYVSSTEGPLVDGERERARRWGERLAATCATSRPAARRTAGAGR